MSTHYMACSKTNDCFTPDYVKKSVTEIIFTSPLIVRLGRSFEKLVLTMKTLSFHISFQPPCLLDRALDYKTSDRGFE